MTPFVSIVALFAGMFWRHFTRTTVGAIALVCAVVVGTNLFFLALVVSPVFFWRVVAIEATLFTIASIAWLLLLTGNGRLLIFGELLFFLLASFLLWSSVPLQIILPAVICITILIALFFYSLVSEIKEFMASVRDQLSSKNVLIQKWLPPSPKKGDGGDVLILTASSGFGHMVAARNIATEIERSNPCCAVVCINIFDYTTNTFRNINEGYWEYLCRNAPMFYRLIHRFVVRSKILKKFARRSATVAAIKLQEKLPHPSSVIVATHPFAVAVGSALKEMYGGKLVVVPTDFYIHQQYLASNVDLYCLSRNCLFVGVEKEQILSKSIITGIPTSSDDNMVRISKLEAKRKLGIPEERTTVLVSFGGSCFLRPKRLIELISLLWYCERPFHFLVFTGNNMLLRELISVISMRKAPKNGPSFSFVEDTKLALAASNVMIGKVGGLSASEALASDMPIGIWEHGGPEDFNAAYLIAKNLGKYVGGFRELLFDFRKSSDWIESLK